MRQPTRIFGILIALVFFASAQDIRFSPQGRWMDLYLYAASACNLTSQPVTIQGNQIWYRAQTEGLGPRTHAELQRRIDEQNRASAPKIALSIVEGGSWAASAIVPLVGKDWPSGQQVIPPLVGGALRLYSVLTERHAPAPPAIPADYVPAMIELPARGCWVGSLIGGP
jgi:hypothetical protein